MATLYIGHSATRHVVRHVVLTAVRQVDADDFGLAVEDLLMAEEKELNKRISLKKLAPYRTLTTKEKAKLRKAGRDLHEIITQQKATGVAASDEPKSKKQRADGYAGGGAAVVSESRMAAYTAHKKPKGDKGRRQ